MTGSIKDYTPNFNLIIPEFNITGWHDYLEENFRSIDALFYNLFGINNFKGQWKNSTVYNVDDVVFIGEDTNYSGRLVKVLVQHTTAGTGNFTEFFTANPSYYKLFADASTAQIYAQQAKDWAVKTDGPVEAGLYSSKYYADLVNAMSTKITSLYQIKDSMVNLDNIKENIVNVDTNKTNININANNINSIINTSNNISNINSVANNETNINAVNSNKININAVNSNKTNIDKTANNLEYIQNTATNINDIIICSDNINAIQDASQAALDAQTAATNAINAETNASTYATQAANSAQSAQTYSNNSQTSATNAANSATSAASSASSANTYATNASVSATNAQNFTTSAQNASNLAKDWANKMDGPVEGSNYSAKYYADLVDNLSTEITTLYNITNDIQTVANISTDIENVADNETNINTVASMQSDINAVNANKTNIDAVVANSSNININAANINAINTNASNISAIQNAYSNAQSAISAKNKAQEWATSENLVDNIDYSAKYYANQSQTSAELSAQYANNKINQTHITNCITEIPQDIKLELNNGTLTLKAGSKVYVPNGAGVFDTKTYTNDSIYTLSYNGIYFIFSFETSGIHSSFVTSTYSGPTAPTVSGSAYWYDTTNNKIKYTTDSGSTWQGNNISLPLAIITVSNGAISSIDQVFNGFGYMGSTVFALPEVKGLIPNGRNEDGTLKSRLLTLTKVATGSYSGTATLYFGCSNDSGAVYFQSTNNVKYEPETNTTNWGVCIFGSFKSVSGVFSDYTPKTVFHALGYNDSSTISGWAMPSNRFINLTLGASGTQYTAPANGMLYFAKKATAVNQYIGFIHSDSNYQEIMRASGAVDIFVNTLVRKGETVTVVYSTNGTTSNDRFMFIYAEGEK